MSGRNKRNSHHDPEDTAESNVIAALEEQRLRTSKNLQHDDNDSPAILPRVAHLPYLVRKMQTKTRAIKNQRHRSMAKEDDDIALFAAKDVTSSNRSSSQKLSNRQASLKDKKNSTRQSQTSAAEPKPKEPSTTFQAASDQDAFLTNAFHLTELMEEDKDDASISSLESDDDYTYADAVVQGRGSYQKGSSGSTSVQETSALLQDATTTQRKRTKHKRQRKKQKTFKRRLESWKRRTIAVVHPEDVKQSLHHYLVTHVLWGMVPPLVLALILFYGLGNPDLEFLPNTATLAWYLLFLVRLQVTLGLARATQFLLELATIRTSWLAQCSGPLVALMAMQAIGWPFLLQAWGVWNIMLLHGHHVFSKHWLYWTNLRIFTVEYNPDGDGILQSEKYGRLLFAMVFVGLVSAIKRTTVALFLSRRMLGNYKQQLERLMSKVQLLAGVAGLATETEKPGFAELLEDVHENADEEDDAESIATAVSTQVQIERKTPYMDSVPMFAESQQGTIDQPSTPTDADLDDGTELTYEEKWGQLKDKVDTEETGRTIPDTIEENKVTPSNPSKRSSTFDRVYSSLDRYDAPQQPGSGSSQEEAPSLQDILQFKRAQSFMTSPFPFSTSFGPAETRKTCVRSAIKVFRKLQRFMPTNDAEDSISFNVIGALAYTESGELDEQRAEGLLRLFLPDKDNCVELTAFVQTCDKTYKDVLFLGASMANSSKIDSVLEDIFNVAFYGVLVVFILSLLGLNPWPLLVSFSTMLLSLAFALGPSCAKTIEGILTVAVRRPFDLGDRISLASGLATSSAGLGNTWFVVRLYVMRFA